MKGFNGKPNHASDKATAKLAALQTFVYWSAAVLRESFDSILQYTGVASRASEWFSIVNAGRADACASICFRLIHLTAANRKSVEKTHAESDDVPDLKRFTSLWLGNINFVVRAIGTVTTRIFGD
jgi:hypothetical protein